MTLESLITIGATIIAVVSAPFIFMWKQMINRVEQLEKKQQETYSKEETRLLIEDMKSDVKEDLSEVKTRLDKIIDKLMNQ